MRRAWILVASLSMCTVPAHAQTPQHSVGNGAGVFWDGLENRLHACSGCAFQQCEYRPAYGVCAQPTSCSAPNVAGTSFPNLTTSLPFFINFIDTSGGSAWTAALKAYIVSFFNNLCSATWWQEQAGFPAWAVASRVGARNWAQSCPYVAGTTANQPNTTAASFYGWNCSTGYAVALNLYSDFASGQCIGQVSITGCGSCGTICASPGNANDGPLDYPGGPSGSLAVDDMLSTFLMLEMNNMTSACYSVTGPTDTFCGSAAGEGAEVTNETYDVAPTFPAPNGGISNYNWVDADSGVAYGALLYGAFIPNQGGGVWTDMPTNQSWWTTACRSNADCASVPYSGICDFAQGHCVAPRCDDGVKNQFELAPDYPCNNGNGTTGSPCSTMWDCNKRNYSAGYPSDFFFNCIGADGGVASGTCQPFYPAPCDAGFCQYNGDGGVCVERQACRTLADCNSVNASTCGVSSYTSCTGGFCQ